MDSETVASGSFQGVSQVMDASETETLLISETESLSETVKSDDSPASEEAVAAETTSGAAIPTTQPVDKKNDDEVYLSVEKQAEFPGGLKAMMEWLGE